MSVALQAEHGPADGSNLEQTLEVDVVFNQAGQTIDLGRAEGLLLGGPQPQMPLGNAEFGLLGQAAQDGDRAGVLQRLSQVVEMPRAANAVEDHPGQPEFRVKMLKAVHQRGHASGHGRGIDQQNDRQPQPFGHLGRTAGLGFAVIAVKGAHHAFHQPDVHVLHGAGKTGPVIVLAQHPAVQVVRGGSGDGRVMARIDEIGTDLEAPDPPTALMQGRQQTQRQRGLSHPAVRPGDDTGVHSRGLCPRPEPGARACIGARKNRNFYGTAPD